MTLKGPDMRRTVSRVSVAAQDTRVRLLLDVLLMLGFSALAAFGKHIHPSMGVPGSSGIYWLGPLVAGRALVRRDGAGLAMGVMVPVWGLSMGLNNSMGYNLGLYGVTGLSMDLAARVPGLALSGLVGCVMSGAIGHMVKFSYILMYAYVAGI